MGGSYYYYDQEPTSPYPDYVSSDYVDESDEDSTAAQQQQPGLMPPPIRFFCQKPNGFYPDVQACSTAWQVMLVLPPGALPPPPGAGNKPPPN